VKEGPDVGGREGKSGVFERRDDVRAVIGKTRGKRRAAKKTRISKKDLSRSSRKIGEK